MINVKFDNFAAEKVLQYFEDYAYTEYGTDMSERAYKISRIRFCLSHIDTCFDEIYVINDKNFLDIDNFCRVEFSIDNNLSEVLIKDIFFK